MESETTKEMEGAFRKAGDEKMMASIDVWLKNPKQVTNDIPKSVSANSSDSLILLSVKCHFRGTNKKYFEPVPFHSLEITAWLAVDQVSL